MGCQNSTEVRDGEKSGGGLCQGSEEKVAKSRQAKNDALNKEKKERRQGGLVTMVPADAQAEFAALEQDEVERREVIESEEENDRDQLAERECYKRKKRLAGEEDSDASMTDSSGYHHYFPTSPMNSSRDELESPEEASLQQQRHVQLEHQPLDKYRQDIPDEHLQVTMTEVGNSIVSERELQEQQQDQLSASLKSCEEADATAPLDAGDYDDDELNDTVVSEPCSPTSFTRADLHTPMDTLEGITCHPAPSQSPERQGQGEETHDGGADGAVKPQFVEDEDSTKYVEVAARARLLERFGVSDPIDLPESVVRAASASVEGLHRADGGATNNTNSGAEVLRGVSLTRGESPQACPADEDGVPLARPVTIIAHPKSLVPDCPIMVEIASRRTSLQAAPVSESPLSRPSQRSSPTYPYRGENSSVQESDVRRGVEQAKQDAEDVVEKGDREVKKVGHQLSREMQQAERDTTRAMNKADREVKQIGRQAGRDVLQGEKDLAEAAKKADREVKQIGRQAGRDVLQGEEDVAEAAQNAPEHFREARDATIDAVNRTEKKVFGNPDDNDNDNVSTSEPSSAPNDDSDEEHQEDHSTEDHTGEPFDGGGRAGVKHNKKNINKPLYSDGQRRLEQQTRSQNKSIPESRRTDSTSVVHMDPTMVADLLTTGGAIIHLHRSKYHHPTKGTNTQQFTTPPERTGFSNNLTTTPLNNKNRNNNNDMTSSVNSNKSNNKRKESDAASSHYSGSGSDVDISDVESGSNTTSMSNSKRSDKKNESETGEAKRTSSVMIRLRRHRAATAEQQPLLSPIGHSRSVSALRGPVEPAFLDYNPLSSLRVVPLVSRSPLIVATLPYLGAEASKAKTTSSRSESSSKSGMTANNSNSNSNDLYEALRRALSNTNLTTRYKKPEAHVYDHKHDPFYHKDNKKAVTPPARDSLRSHHNSWNLLESIPDGVSRVCAGDVLVRYTMCSYKDLVPDDKAMIDSIVNETDYWWSTDPTEAQQTPTGPINIAQQRKDFYNTDHPKASNTNRSDIRFDTTTIPAKQNASNAHIRVAGQDYLGGAGGKGPRRIYGGNPSDVTPFLDIYDGDAHNYLATAPVNAHDCSKKHKVQLNGLSFVLVRMMAFVPYVRSSDINVDVVQSHMYQRCVSDEADKFDTSERPRTLRKEKTILPKVFSLVMQLSGWERYKGQKHVSMRAPSVAQLFETLCDEEEAKSKDKRPSSPPSSPTELYEKENTAINTSRLDRLALQEKGCTPEMVLQRELKARKAEGKTSSAQAPPADALYDEEEDDYMHLFLSQHGMVPDRIVFCERSRRNRGGKNDGTVKVRWAHMMYDVEAPHSTPHAPIQPYSSSSSSSTQVQASLQEQLQASRTSAAAPFGVLYSYTTVIVRSSLPTLLTMMGSHLGTKVAAESVTHTQLLRGFLRDARERCLGALLENLRRKSSSHSTTDSSSSSNKKQDVQGCWLPMVCGGDDIFGCARTKALLVRSSEVVAADEEEYAALKKRCKE